MGPELHIRSSAFDAGTNIPQLYTADGKNLSPPLQWTDPPPRTKSFALICDDPDAPTPQPWVHWIACNIPADVRSLPESISPRHELREAGGVQGRNSFGKIGYGGPAPPPRHGVHHYHFKLYALDRLLDPEPEFSKDDLVKAMNGHVVAEAQLVGTYER